MNPLILPILRIALWSTLVGAAFAAMLGLLRRTDSATHRRDWVRLGLLIAVGLAIAGAGALGPWGLFPVLLILACMSWVELMRCISRKYGPAALPALHGTLAACFGLAFISVPLGTLLLLARQSYGAFALLIVLVSFNDGFAAGFGRLLGRTPLCPHISPGKTWEGTFGSLAVCVGIGVLVRYLVPTWSAGRVALVSSGVSGLCLIGDLVASCLKREAGIKDFGTALPVVGGILDRFDSLLFATPVFYVIVRLMPG